MTNIINNLFLIVGLGYFVPFIQAIPYGNVNYQTQKDCQTLLDIYQHFQLNLPFKSDSNCCDYYVRLAASNDNYPTTEWICDSSNTINAIMIKDRNISTDIPWNLFEKLENLEVLHLYNNQLTGEIKPDLRNFSNLKQLRVQNNNLKGYLPTYLPPKIETLIFNGNEINDSVPNEWKSVTTIRDCIIPNTICNPRNSQMACYTDSTKNDKTSVCKNDAQEDRSAAHQILNNENNNDNNNVMDNYDNNMDNYDNNMDNGNDIENDNNNLMNYDNNMDYDGNIIDNGNQHTNNGMSKEGKRSPAVLIMTLSIISLLLIILLIVTIVSHYSRKKTREKEKDIYKGTTLYENSDQTEASIFYSKNSNNMYAYDENNNNSISLFNYTNPHETENNINNINDINDNNNQLLVGGSQSDELSFIENAPQNSLEEVSFSVIDPSAEFIEPQPAAIKQSYNPIM